VFIEIRTIAENMGRYTERKAVVEAEDRASPYGDDFSIRKRHADVTYALIV
jgi:hypothetical protein